MMTGSVIAPFCPVWGDAGAVVAGPRGIDGEPPGRGASLKKEEERRTGAAEKGGGEHRTDLRGSIGSGRVKLFAGAESPSR